MTSDTKLDKALTQIDQWIGPQGSPGVAVAVWRAGQIIGVRTAGERKPGYPVDPETIFALASVTKPITAAVVMSLLEVGLLSLDEQVARLLPEFGKPSNGIDANDNLEQLRSTITVRQLLSHTSGLPEELPAGTLRLKLKPSMNEIVEAMVRVPLRAAPGSEFLYSNAGYATLGAIVEQLTGQDFWQVAEEQVFSRSVDQGFYARPDAELEDRLVTVTDVPRADTDSESYNSQYWRDLAYPWGGLFGTVGALAHFAGAFLDGQNRFLSSASVQEMTSDQVKGLRGEVQSARVDWPVAWWGLGWEVKGDKRRHWTGDLTSAQTFCHFGASGTLLWADPAIGVAAAIFANRTTTHLWPFVPARWARLSNSIVAALS